MSKIDHDEQDEKPLDPVLEKVRRKMIRLQLVSAGVMVIALMAVLIAIVYKANHANQASRAPAITEDVPNEGTTIVMAALPEGFKVNATQLSGDRVLFDGTDKAGQRKMLVFNIRRGRIEAEIAVGAP
ncbi:hypothetical protein [Rhizobium sp. C4]|uniref:hypothetical protein n=1 Tax=Rhizobium sp. C4 TaxID=1349800 RepID=UPI001E339FCD|nr:hypothetical protein [Rhizobium sp. C4]MCD2174213.1 hypothetical protein [Rhizobium sp. C4]